MTQERGKVAEHAGAVLIRKSNLFVGAKFKTSLLGNKLIAISLSRLNKEGSQYSAVLHAHEIKSLLGTDKNIYARLQAVSKTIVGNIITVENPDPGGDHGSFKTFAMITNVNYSSGILKIYFNREMSPYIGNLKSNYTAYELARILSFRSNSTLRLYELLKKEAWKIPKSPGGYTTATYNLSELKCILGLVNMDQSYISAAKNNGKSWDEIVEVIAKKEDRQYDSYRDFRVNVLLVAQKEMEEGCDITFTFEPKRKGRGGKVYEIVFTIRYNNIVSTDAEERVLERKGRIEETIPEVIVMDQERASRQISETYESLLEYLKEAGVDTSGFTYEYFKTLIRMAKNDPERIRKEIDYSKTIPDIRNYYAWLLRAVENGYSSIETVETLYGSSERAKAVREIAESAKPNEDMLRKLWEKYKSKEGDTVSRFVDTFDYPDLEAVEEMYAIDEIIKKFIEFKRTAGSGK